MLRYKVRRRVTAFGSIAVMKYIIAKSLLVVGTGEGLGREPHRVDKVRNLLADRLVVIDDSYNGLFGHGPPLPVSIRKVCDQIA